MSRGTEDMLVDRCVCFDVSFETLKRYAEAHGADVADLQRAFQCGCGCTMCLPYIHHMLRTGETRIPVFPEGAQPCHGQCAGGVEAEGGPGAEPGGGPGACRPEGAGRPGGAVGSPDEPR